MSRFVQFNWSLNEHVGECFAESVVECTQNMLMTNQQMCFRAERRQNAGQLDGDVTRTDDNCFPEFKSINTFTQTHKLWQLF